MQCTISYYNLEGYGLIVERLIDKFKFVLAYRTRSANEVVLSRTCSSLINLFSRFVTFSRRPAPVFVATVRNLSNFWIV